MNQSSIRSAIASIESELLNGILPFWIRNARNARNGGFYGSICDELKVDENAVRGGLLTARILWTYSAAFGKYGCDQYRSMADYAYRDLISHYWDDRQGGFWWSIQPNGAISHGRKLIYGQAFAIYALAEYHMAVGDCRALELAIETFRRVEENARDRRFGGYQERFLADWSVATNWRPNELGWNAPKSLNTHLHLLESYSKLYEAWPDSELLDSLLELLRIIVAHMLDENGGSLLLYFSHDWKSIDSEVSHGHNIECSWLLTRLAENIGSPSIASKMAAIALKLANATLRHGTDCDGSIFSSSLDKDAAKVWWVQAEGLVGFLNAFSLSDDERFLHAAVRIWNFIEHRLVDRNHGEWFAAVGRDGTRVLGEAKVGFWKCPYHNTRACLEAGERLHSIMGQL